jgi:hypothetical protein
MEVLPDTLEQLTARLDTLERRVFALEHPSDNPVSVSVQQAAAIPAAPIAEPLSFAQAGGIFSLLGKAMLGIAGAYVLRAVAESTTLPKSAVAAVAIGYAIFWLVWSARTKAGEWLASTIYACTSALILGPMLWELTLRFKVLSPSMSAGVLCGFVLGATVLAWKRNLAPVFWVANGSAALVALALLVATHDMPPFIATLLLMVLVCEVSAVRNHEMSVRPIVAMAADVAIWALVFIYSSAQSTRTEYPPLGAAKLLSPAILLLAIYAVSVTLRTVLQKRKISVFETIQTLFAFLLAAGSLLYFVPGTGAAVLGGLCLVLSAATYGLFILFIHREVEPRNERVFAAWSAALLLAGSWLTLPPNLLAAFVGLAAVAATNAGVRKGWLTLKHQGLLYLVAAAVASGLPGYAFNALAGNLPAANWGVCLVTAFAVACYAVANSPHFEESRHRLLQLITALLAVCAIAALLVQGIFALGIAPDAVHIAFIRTLVTCVLALGLAFCGSRWHGAELNWIAYAALVFVAAKLLFEDLRHGNLGFIAASIFVFAVTLMVVPRLARMGNRGNATAT